MLNPAHLLEIAMLLLVAFLCGAAVGSLARLAALRLARPKLVSSAAVESGAAPLTADVPAPVVEPPALVAAPVIGEVAKTPAPTAPADVPAPDFTEALLALAGDRPGTSAPTIHIPRIAPLPDVTAAKPAEQMGPARVAGATTSGRAVAHPRTVAAPTAAPIATGASAEVIPFPLEKLAADTAPAAAPLAQAAEVVAVAAAGPVAADDTGPEAASADETAHPLEQPSVTAEAAVTEPMQSETVDGPAATDAPEDQGESQDQDQHQDAGLAIPATADAAPPPEDAVEAVAPSESAEASGTAAAEDSAPQVSATALATTAEDDEAAAMRAIEGSWSPRRASSGKARRAELPEIAADEAVFASGAAVSSAARAVQLAVAPDSDEPQGKPEGISAPRLGVKDDLTHVIGILPIIETALNRLGLYHFDQIADLTDEHADWIETHLGIAGRIGREHWREQAREIAAAMASAKQAAGS